MLENESDKQIREILNFWKYLEKLGQGKIPENFKSLTLNKAVEKIESKIRDKEKKNSSYCEDAINIKGTINLKEIDNLIELIKEYKKKFKLDSCSNIIITVGSFYEDDLLHDIYEKYNLDDVEKGINRNNYEYALFGLKVNNNGEYFDYSLQISPIFSLIKNLDKKRTNDLERYLKGKISYKNLKKLFNELKIDNMQINDNCIVNFKLYDSSNYDIGNCDLYNDFFKNDFYSDDIEMVINNFDKLDVEKKYIGALLENNILLDNRQDVFDYDVLCNILSIKNMPLGRWPSQYNQSLLQQIAINISTSQYINDFDQNGILAVDGPPGTGKTTMVKDIIANLLVSKAALLGKYDIPDNAFVKKNDNNYYELEKKEINDFSILIASSNNDAIKNIMKELPLISSVLIENDSFKETNKIIEEDSYYNKIVKSINKNYWANICGILGNYNNRKSFCKNIDRLLKAVDDIKKQDSDGLLKEYSETKKLFFKYYEELSHKKCKYLEAENYHKLDKELKKLKNEYAKFRNIGDSISEYDNEQRKIKLLKLKEFLKNIFKSKNKKENFYKNQYNKIEKITSKSKELVQLDCDSKVLELYNVIYDVENIIDKLQKNEIEDIKSAHLYNPYDNEYDNRLREKLFITAVKLIFLFAVNSNIACENLRHMKDYIENIKRNDYKNIITLYETAFLFFPIISSAFASVTTMFKDVQFKNVFGYLIIDEAGQAEPQQAIGGLYRCKKAIIIGDPKQLTPIVGDGIINVIKKMVSKGQNNKLSQYIDVNNSIQLFADKINGYGINKMNWQPLPLLVHRRCINPMFKISNKLSYNNQMLHETFGPKNDVISTLMFKEKSTWFNISGVNDGDYKYYNEAQGRKVASLLKEYYEEYKSLPNMFVITPFKEIKIQIKADIMDYFKENVIGYDNEKLKLWLNDNISTIHSFQGKEANEVILVLGGSLSLKGSNVINNFVSANLVNVAVTRAKYRLCVIGDIRIWKDNDNVFEVYENLVSENLKEMLLISNDDKNSKKINELMPSKNYYIIEDELNGEIIYLDAINEVIKKVFKGYELKSDSQLIKILNNLPNKFSYLNDNMLAPAKYITSLIELDCVDENWDFSFAGAQLTKIIEKIANQEIWLKVYKNKEKLNVIDGKEILNLLETKKNPTLETYTKCARRFKKADISRKLSTEILDDFVKVLDDFRKIRNNVCHRHFFNMDKYNKLIKLGYTNEDCIINDIDKIFKF